MINFKTEWLGKAWFGLEQLQIQLFDQRRQQNIDDKYIHHRKIVAAEFVRKLIYAVSLIWPDLIIVCADPIY